VLLIDGWAAFAEPGDPRSDRLDALLANGLAVGITVCLASDETLRSKTLKQISHRLMLHLNDPNRLPRPNVPVRIRPGRARWEADGTEVQLALPSADPSGRAQADAIAALAAELHVRCATSSAPQRAPLRLDPLPLRINLTEAVKLVPGEHDGPAAMVGVGGDTLTAVSLPISEHRRFLIAGPPRSGRSTAAATIAASLRGHVRVLSVAGRARSGGGSDPSVVAATEIGPETTADVVIIDDADVLPPDHPAFAAAPVVVLTASLDAAADATRGPLHDQRRNADAVILLAPGNRFTAQKFDRTFTQAMMFSGPPGRAYLITGGLTLLVQVPEPD
jgi:hypothetical protein